LSLIKLAVIGVDSLSNRLAGVSRELKEEVQAEVRGAAMEYVALAKRDCVSSGGNTGTLARSISYKKETPYSYLVSANTFYAPYVEFGTKRKFKPYPGTEEFAAQYKGLPKRGDWIDMLMSIYKWVQRKGIGATYSVKTRKKVRQTKDQKLQIAFAITMSILRNGVEAKPFFYKQIPIVRESLNKRIKALLSGI
jgi:HK97 gp10 family phage protein